MRKILISILLLVSSASIARTATCLKDVTDVAFFDLPHSQREIYCFRDGNLVQGFTEALVPVPTGPNWSQLDYINGYVYANVVYASICHVSNNDPNTCAFTIA